jgi:hypothetical protein
MTPVCIYIYLVAGCLLVTSYFLPYEGWDWSPYLMAQGYQLAGGEMAGPAVFLVESAHSAGLGLAILGATSALLFDRRRFSNGVLLAFGAVWFAAILIYVAEFFQLPAIQHRILWIVMAAVAIPIFIVSWILLLKASDSVARFHFIVLLLGCASLLWNIVVITFALVDDIMLLNYGAVVSAVGTTAITLGAIFGIATGKERRYNS